MQGWLAELHGAMRVKPSAELAVAAADQQAALAIRLLTTAGLSRQDVATCCGVPFRSDYPRSALDVHGTTDRTAGGDFATCPIPSVGCGKIDADDRFDVVAATLEPEPKWQEHVWPTTKFVFRRSPFSSRHRSGVGLHGGGAGDRRAPD